MYPADWNKDHPEWKQKTPQAEMVALLSGAIGWLLTAEDMNMALAVKKALPLAEQAMEITHILGFDKMPEILRFDKAPQRLLASIQAKLTASSRTNVHDGKQLEVRCALCNRNLDDPAELFECRNEHVSEAERNKKELAHLHEIKTEAQDLLDKDLAGYLSLEDWDHFKKLISTK